MKNYKSKKQTNGGITLIVLIITVILLLILAGITINITLGERGIIKIANQSKEESNKAKMKEELELKLVDIVMEKDEKTKPLEKNDIDKLTNIGATIQNYSPIIMGEYKGYTFIVDEDNSVRLEKIVNDEIPVVTVEKQVNLENGEVSIKIIANVDIASIQILQEEGVSLKNDGGNRKKEYSIKKNGTYYFLIMSNNGRNVMQEVTVDEFPDPKLEVVANKLRYTINMNVKDLYNIEWVKEIQYYINDEVVQRNTETSYTTEVEPGTYRVKVVIDFKDGTQKVTNEEEEEFEKVVYLYKNGNKYSDLTGGYSFRRIQTTDVSSTDSTYFHMYAHSRKGVGYGEIELYTNNTIDVTKFDTINFDMDYSVVFGQEAWRTHFYYGLQNARIVDIPGTNSSSGRVIPMNIKDINGSYRPYFRVLSCSCNSDCWVTIRSIYLVRE